MEPHGFWQGIAEGPPPPPPYIGRFPALLPDGAVLWLPIRDLEGTGTGLASLIINQASFAVADRLAGHLAESLGPHAPDIVIGLPTLGLSLAASVARRLGHDRFVPLGTSRKFWYDDTLSVELRSVTSPSGSKRLYVDPRMLPLLEGRRIAVIDDALSTGSSMTAALRLLEMAGASPVVVGAAMLQTLRWRDLLPRGLPVSGVFNSPLLHRRADGYWPS